MFFGFSQNLMSQNIDPNGYNTFFHENGKIASEGFFKKGLPDGIWNSYNTNGILISTGKKINGMSDSVWTFYSNKGELKNKFSSKEISYFD